MRYIFFVLLALIFFVTNAHAGDALEETLILKNHSFIPGELTVPSGQKIKITVKNKDNTAAEFESFELNREKIVPANSEITVYLDPLDPGTYPFFDDFHQETTTGKIIAK